MKNVMQTISSILVGLMIFTTGCRKDDILKQPPHGGSGNGNLSNAFRFRIDSLPGQPNGADGLYALISITNESNQAVLTDSRLALQFNSHWFSDSIILPNGNYKLAKFLVLKDTITRFATPLVNSTKASMVQRPLSISFDLPKSSVNIVPVEVLSIGNDQPEIFGYPTGTWNRPGGSTPPPTDPNPSVKIKIRGEIKIGDVLYDSIATKFTWICWDANGKMLSTGTNAIAAGTNEVALSSTAYKYNLQVEKWGIHAEIELLKSDIHEGTVYKISANSAAKKLKSELTYKWANGAYVPESKTAYQYDGSGRMLEIVYYLRKADNTPYVSSTDKFTYDANGMVEKVKRYDSANNLIVQTSFAYDNDGRVSYFGETNGGSYTSGQVTYTAASGIGNQTIHIKYGYTQSPFTMNYNMSFRNGNKVQDAAASTTNSSESGTYQYDQNINPYIHMNWPTIWLSNVSKNNMISQQKSYVGSTPTVLPYGFNYTYDSEGYPKELVKTYFSYYGGIYAFTTKTVYNY
jgi:hypothetical protein